MSSYKLTRSGAMFVTFLLSAAAHELVMAIVTKKIRFYLFMMQVRSPPLRMHAGPREADRRRCL